MVVLVVLMMLMMKIIMLILWTMTGQRMTTYWVWLHINQTFRMKNKMVQMIRMICLMMVNLKWIEKGPMRCRTQVHQVATTRARMIKMIDIMDIMNGQDQDRSVGHVYHMVQEIVVVIGIETVHHQLPGQMVVLTTMMMTT